VVEPITRRLGRAFQRRFSLSKPSDISTSTISTISPREAILDDIDAMAVSPVHIGPGLLSSPTPTETSNDLRITSPIAECGVMQSLSPDREMEVSP